MSEKYDAAIVGAGVGGLAAAGWLIKAGLRVVVLERNRHPGGTAFNFSRKGFTFPTGPLGFSSPSVVMETLEEFGRDKGFELYRAHYRARAFGLDVPLSLPFEQMKKELANLFPQEAETVRKFFGDMQRIAADIKSDDAGSANPELSLSARDYLDGLTKDPRLRRILGSIGTSEPYSGLGLLAAMWNLMCEQGVWRPKGGMRSLCQRLEQAAQKDSPGAGEVRLGTEVARINANKGKAPGVALADGAEIEAGAIISNADYKTTFLSLVNPDDVTIEFYEAIENARQTMSNLQVSLGLDAQRIDLSAFKRASRLICRRESEDEPPKIDWNAEKIDPYSLAGQEMEVSLFSADDESAAPPGKAVIIIRTEAEYSHFEKYRPERGKRTGGYLEYKNGLGRALAGEAAKIVAGLDEAIEVMDVATPLTFEERGGRSRGAVAGWSWDFEDNPDFGARELVRTPIKGLYMAGYQAFTSLFMGGVPLALTSGARAARAVLAAEGPADEIMIPGVKK